MAWSGINFVNVNTFPWPSWKGRNDSLGVRRLKKIDRWGTPCVVGFKASAHKGVKFLLCHSCCAVRESVRWQTLTLRGDVVQSASKPCERSMAVYCRFEKLPGCQQENNPCLKERESQGSEWRRNLNKKTNKPIESNQKHFLTFALYFSGFPSCYLEKRVFQMCLESVQPT